MSQDSTHKTFFRQSGWMVFSVVLSGFIFYGVHPFAKKIPVAEYGVFGTLLTTLNLMAMPGLGLQSVFAKQTAVAVTERERRELATTARGVLAGTFVLWLMAAVCMFFFRDSILSNWKIQNPATLWLMAAVLLVTLWTPVFSGQLQGSQNFLWLGWAQIFNSVGRLVGVAVIVLVFHGWAAGMAAGLLFGTFLCMAVSGIFSRHLWIGPGAPADWNNWCSRVVPLTLGMSAFNFMFFVDPLFVQYYSDGGDTGFYIAAGTLGRALCAFTGPVVAVMFPKVVRSAAFKEKSNVMTLTLIITAVMALIGAFGLSVIAPWLLTKVIYREAYRAAVPLLSWFACAMIPLALANVLLNNLLARSQFAVVPWAVVVAAGYSLGLIYWGNSTYTVSSFKDPVSLAAKAEQASDEVSAFLKTKLSGQTFAVLTNYQTCKADLSTLQTSLARELSASASVKSELSEETFLALTNSHLAASNLVTLQSSLAHDINASAELKRNLPEKIRVAWTNCQAGMSNLPELQMSLPSGVSLGGKLPERLVLAWTYCAVGTSNLLALQTVLAHDVNGVITGESIYTAQRFAGVELRPKTKRLLDENPKGKELVRLNRLLLEDAYEVEISRTHPGTFIEVIQILCVFNFLFLGVVGAFGWRESRTRSERPVATATAVAG